MAGIPPWIGHKPACFNLDATFDHSPSTVQRRYRMAAFRQTKGACMPVISRARVLVIAPHGIRAMTMETMCERFE
jgi:hypothetical protein